MMNPNRWVRLLLIVFVIVLSVLFFLRRAHLGAPGSCTIANAYGADCQEMLADYKKAHSCYCELKSVGHFLGIARMFLNKTN